MPGFRDPKHNMTSLTNEQEFDLQAQFKTGLGNPAVVTDISWASSDTAVASVVVNPADTSKVVVQGLAPGNATITVEAKNSKGATVSGTYSVTVEMAEATTVVFVAGEPRPKPAPPETPATETAPTTPAAETPAAEAAPAAPAAEAAPATPAAETPPTPPASPS